MTINLKKVFGDELLDAELISEGLKHFPVITESEITVDYSGCVMEYDATGIITDHLIDSFGVRNSSPKIIIIYDLDYPEDYLLDFLFSETRFLGEETASLDNAVRKKLLEEKLRLCGGSIEIRISDTRGEKIIKKYEYGKF